VTSWEGREAREEPVRAGRKSVSRKQLNRAVAKLSDALDADEQWAITEEYYLSINGRGLSQILQFHAATKPDNPFGTDDLKLSFERSTNGFNDAERLIENYGNQAAILWPEKLRNRHT
jgi:hypothetical protein